MNTERSLRALFEAFVAAPHDTHHGPNLVAAVFAYARVRAPCVEDWETGPHGVGMSDKAVCEPECSKCGVAMSLWDVCGARHCPCRAVACAGSRAPEREEPSGRATEAQDGRGGSEGAVGAARQRFATRPLLFDRLSPEELDAATRPDEPEHVGGPDGKELESPTRPVGEPMNPSEPPECRTSEALRVNPAPIMPERGERVPLHPEKGPRQKISVDQSFGHPDTAKAGTSGPMGASMFRTGNALAEERGGISNAPDSPLHAFTGPSDPAKRRVPRPEERPAQRIIEGLQEAVAFAKGEPTGARVRVVTINPEDDGA